MIPSSARDRAVSRMLIGIGIGVVLLMAASCYLPPQGGYETEAKKSYELEAEVARLSAQVGQDRQLLATISELTLAVTKLQQDVILLRQSMGTQSRDPEDIDQLFESLWQDGGAARKALPGEHGAQITVLTEQWRVVGRLLDRLVKQAPRSTVKPLLDRYFAINIHQGLTSPVVRQDLFERLVKLQRQTESLLRESP